MQAQRSSQEQVLPKQPVVQGSPLGLYIHIPFCVRKCRYCDFLSAPASDEVRAAYLRSLNGQIRAIGRRLQADSALNPSADDSNVRGNERANNTISDYMVDSIFIGGGTPSLLSSSQMTALMDTVRESFVLSSDVEITAECNPGTVNEEKLRAYKKAGINRLSIGLQSSDNEELALLGRIHTWEDFLATFELARSVGFDNINIDVMGSLPGQTPASYQKTLERVLALRPEHISAYSLIIEEGTPFFDEYGDEDACRVCSGDGQKALPSEDEVVQMDELTWKLLAQAGYEHYEISNYALSGRQCKHNLKYWHCGEYLGVGTGAASYIRRKSDFLRLKVRTDTKEFSQINWELPESIFTCYLECETLTRFEQMEEMAFLGLRTKEGVRLADFYARFGETFDEVYGDVIKRYTAMGMMQADDTHVALTLKGMEVANWIMADFCG